MISPVVMIGWPIAHSATADRAPNMGEGEKQTLIHRVRFWWMSRAYLLFLFAGLCAAQDKTIRDCCSDATLQSELGPCLEYTSSDVVYGRGDVAPPDDPLPWVNCSAYSIWNRKSGVYNAVRFNFSSNSPQAPPGITLNATTGRITGTPTQYTLPVSLLINPIDALGRRGLGINVNVAVGPREQPTSISFSDISPRKYVYVGQVTIQPAADERNFTDYLTVITQDPQVQTPNIFSSTVQATGGVVVDQVTACLITISLWPQTPFSSVRCPGPFDMPGLGEVFISNIGFFNPQYIGTTAAVSLPRTDDPSGNSSKVQAGPNYASVSLADSISEPPVAAAAVFIDVDPVEEAYGGIVSVTTPAALADTAYYLLYFYSNSTCDNPPCPVYIQFIANATVTTPITNITVPYGTVPSNGIVYTQLAIYSQGSQTINSDPLVVNFTDYAPGFATFFLPTGTPSAQVGPSFIIGIDVTHNTTEVVPSAFTIETDPPNAVQVIITAVTGSGSIWYLNVTVVSAPVAAEINVTLSGQFDFIAPSEPFTIAYIPPTATFVSSVGSNGTQTRASTLNFTAVFSSPVIGLSPSDFIVVTSLPVQKPASLIRSADNMTYVYTLTVATTTTDGTLSLYLPPNAAGVYPPNAAAGPFIIVYDPIPAQLVNWTVSPKSPANITTGQSLVFNLTLSKPAAVSTFKLTFGGNTSTVVVPLNSSSGNSCVYRYVVQANDPVGSIGYQFSAVDDLGNQLSVTVPTVNISVVAVITLSTPAGLTANTGAPFAVTIASTRPFSPPFAQYCGNVTIVPAGAATVAVASPANSSVITCTVQPTVPSNISVSTPAGIIPGALPSSVITLPYNIAVNGTGLPSVLLTTNETYQVPAVSISPSFPRASSLTYNWTVLNVSPVGTHTPSISNASAASPLLTNITPGSSVSLQVLVTDPAIVPSFSGSRKSFNTTLAFPAFTTPLMMTGIAPPLSLPSLLSPANTNTCVSGRVCAFTYRVSGVNFTGAGNSSTSFYLLSTPPGPNTVTASLIGSQMISPASSSAMVFNWTVPASSSAGTVAILAVVNVANPVTGGYTTVSSQSPSLQLVTGGYIWAVTTPSSCSVPCGQGVITVNVSCVDVASGTAVSNTNLCGSSPPPSTSPCALAACTGPAAWGVTGLSTCSVSCGTGIANQTIVCLNTTGGVLPDSQCNPAYRPNATAVCTLQPCPTYSLVTTQSPCNATYGAGVTTVIHTCVSSVGTIGDLVADCGYTLPATSAQSCSSSVGCVSGVTLKRGVPGPCVNETNGLVTCGGGTSTRIDSCVSTTNGSTLSASACNVSSLTVVESCAGWPCLSSLPPTLTISLAGPCEFIGYSYPSTPSCAADVFGNTNFSTECIYPSNSSAAPITDCTTVSVPSQCKAASSATMCPANSSTVISSTTCPNGCSGAGACVNGTCACFGEITGEYCTQSSGCSGIVYGGGSECCVGVLTTNAGGVETCCSGPHAVVDSTGTCCVSGQLDARGICNGPAIAIDAAGSYCSTVLDANGLCCASALDVCGVCGGDSTSCGSLLSLNLTSPSGPWSSTPAIGSAQYNTIAQSLSQSLPSLLAVPSSSLTLSSLTSANPPGSLLAGVSVLPSNTSVTAYIPASTPTLPGATVGPYTIASVVSSTPIGVCGNGACELGERCAVTSSASCCPSDCPYIANVCPTSTVFVAALTGTYGTQNVTARLSSCSGTGSCYTDPMGTPTCVCFTGYIGSDCSQCDNGYGILTVNGLCTRLPANGTSPANVVCGTNGQPGCNPISPTGIGAISLVAVAVTVAVAFIAYRLLTKSSRKPSPEAETRPLNGV